MKVPTTQLRGSTWFLRVTLPDGKRHRIRLGPSTMSAEQLAATARAVRAEFDRVGLADVTPVLTMDRWSERWLRARQRRGLTSTGDDEQRWRDWCGSLHKLDVLTVARADVEAVVRALDVAVEEERISWKTAANVWGVVSRMCRDMACSKDPEIRVRATNPAEGVEPPDGGDSAARVYLYPSEALSLISCDEVEPQWRALYTLAMYTGLRRGELDALLWSDIEPTVVRVFRASGLDGKAKKTKTKTARVVPIEATLAPLLEVLRADDGAHVCRAPLWQAPQLRSHLAAAGVSRAALFGRGPGQRPITFHDLRATCATWMALRGDDPLKIQRRMGHTSLATTQRYIREAETLGDVGAPFPSIPDPFLVAVQAAVQDREPERGNTRMQRILSVPNGIRTRDSAVKHRPSEEVGPLAIAGDTMRNGALPGLARTRPTLAPFVGDLERWELAELGATGTRGES